MKLTQFRYKLPQELIAEYPRENRDECRLMVIDRKTKTIEHKIFKDILNYFDEGDTMVLNNTRVFPARMYGNKEKTGAKIEVFLLRELNRETLLWDVLVDPARKIRIGNKLYFGEGEDEMVAEVIDNTTSRGRTLRFLFDKGYDEFKRIIYKLGETPIPKYIRRPVQPEDEFWFQTIFAKHEGAVAPPTAAMHFSRELLKRLEIKGVNLPEITMHLGLGTFRQVEVEDLTKHKMDSEQLIIPEEVAQAVNRSKDERKKVCSVGTATLRGLETSVSTTKHLKAFDGWTNKFIFPPHEFHISNSLLTNFHQPQSTLLMTVAAFAGYDFIFHAYREAIQEGYQFLAYGDCMLIL